MDCWLKQRSDNFRLRWAYLPFETVNIVGENAVEGDVHVLTEENSDPVYCLLCHFLTVPILVFQNLCCVVFFPFFEEMACSLLKPGS